MLTMVVAALILFAILAFGDVLSLITKARLPMMFVALGTYLVLIWSGMPMDLPIVSNMGMFGVVMISPLIVHMATMIPVREFKKQWRAIVVALSGMVFAVALILGVGSIFFGYTKSVAGSGALCGSVVAAVITVDKLKEVGMGALAIIPLAIVAIQEPIGQLVAINILKKHAINIKKKLSSGELSIKDNEEDIIVRNGIQYETDENPSPRFKAWIPKRFETPFVMLLKLFIVAAIAQYIADKTGLHWAVWSLLLGVVAVYFGFLRGKMLDRSGSMGITMAALLFYVFTQMNEVTLEVFGTEIVPVLGILVLGIIGLVIGAIIGGKMVGWPKELAMPVALTALFGFPGNYLITQEACRSVGENNEENDFLMSEMIGPMLIGGYTTVTIGSVVIISVLINTL